MENIVANMSYCRFQNTERDFDECVDAVEELLSGEGTALSLEEFSAAKRLISKSLDLILMLAEFAEVDDNALDETNVDDLYRALTIINRK